MGMTYGVDLAPAQIALGGTEQGPECLGYLAAGLGDLFLARAHEFLYDVGEGVLKALVGVLGGVVVFAQARHLQGAGQVEHGVFHGLVQHVQPESLVHMAELRLVNVLLVQVDALAGLGAQHSVACVALESQVYLFPGAGGVVHEHHGVVAANKAVLAVDYAPGAAVFKAEYLHRVGFRHRAQRAAVRYFGHAHTGAQPDVGILPAPAFAVLYGAHGLGGGGTAQMLVRFQRQHVFHFKYGSEDVAAVELQCLLDLAQKALDVLVECHG